MSITTTEFKLQLCEIPGLLIFDISQNHDNRGYYQEKFQLKKIKEVCKLHNIVFDFNIKQVSLSFNSKKGITRGVHAEPWNKIIYMAKGRVYANFLDTRSHHFNTFGIEINENKVIYLPKGVGNSFQTLEDNVYYNYLQDDTWDIKKAKQGEYLKFNLRDPKLNLKFPINLDSSNIVISDRDKTIPYI